MPSAKMSPPSGAMKPAMQRSAVALAASRGPEQRLKLARPEVDGDVIDRDGAPEPLGEVIELNTDGGLPQGSVRLDQLGEDAAVDVVEVEAGRPAAMVGAVSTI